MHQVHGDETEHRRFGSLSFLPVPFVIRVTRGYHFTLFVDISNKIVNTASRHCKRPAKVLQPPQDVFSLIHLPSPLQHHHHLHPQFEPDSPHPTPSSNLLPSLKKSKKKVSPWLHFHLRFTARCILALFCVSEGRPAVVSDTAVAVALRGEVPRWTRLIISGPSLAAVMGTCQELYLTTHRR